MFWVHHLGFEMEVLIWRGKKRGVENIAVTVIAQFRDNRRPGLWHQLGMGRSRLKGHPGSRKQTGCVCGGPAMVRSQSNRARHDIPEVCSLVLGNSAGHRAVLNDYCYEWTHICLEDSKCQVTYIFLLWNKYKRFRGIMMGNKCLSLFYHWTTNKCSPWLPHVCQGHTAALINPVR